MVAFGCLPFDLDTTEAIKKKNIGELIQRMSENNF